MWPVLQSMLRKFSFGLIAKTRSQQMESLRNNLEAELAPTRPLFCHDIRLPGSNETNSGLSVQLLLVEGQEQRLDDLDDLNDSQVQDHYLSLASRVNQTFRRLAYRIGLSRTRFGIDEEMVNLQFTINQPELDLVRATLQAEASLEALLLGAGGNIHRRLLGHDPVELQPVGGSTDLDLKPSKDWSQLIVLDSARGRWGFWPRSLKPRLSPTNSAQLTRCPKHWF